MIKLQQFENCRQEIQCFSFVKKKNKVREKQEKTLIYYLYT